jgi:hypothetical protein
MCDLTDQHLLSELVDAKSTMCNYCGAAIDLSSADWQARFVEAVRQYHDTHRPPRQ